MYPEVIAVGAIDHSHSRASFSSTGSELDLVAPGSQILTTNRTGGYSITSGTSIAAAHVTGGAALLWSKNSLFTASDIKSQLFSSATHLGTSDEYGYGLINVAKALNLITEAIPPLSNQSHVPDINIWLPSLDGEVTIASYDKVGDGQIITAGETAVVSIKLEGNQLGDNIHDIIIIEVTPLNEPNNVIATTQILNPLLHQDITYEWVTTSNTRPGSYQIKYKYPAMPSGLYDDIFYVYVEQLGSAAPTDLVAIPTSSSIKLAWTPPTNAVSYSVLLNGVYIGETTESTYIFDNLQPLTSYRLAVAAKYIDADMSAYSETTSTTTMEELILHYPKDINQHESSRKFVFNPPTTGVYKIYTSQNSQVNTASDTILEIYTDSAFNNLIYSNDDVEGSAFSEIKHSFNGGESYYVNLSSFSNEPLSARITAEVVSSQIPFIFKNQPIDINENSGDSTIYVFVPTTSGQYQVSTTFYAGRSSSRENDTQLNIYRDANLSELIVNGSNDDTETSVFSELTVPLVAGSPYFISVDGFDHEKVYARLLVTEKEQTPVAITNKTSHSISKMEGEYELLSFTPTTSGVYRMFTSPSVQSVGSIVDTEISLYSNIELTNRLAYNDDVVGDKPYGSLYSKLEYNLVAGNTYYITVKNLESSTRLISRFMIEDSFHSQKTSAQSIDWGDLVEKDGFDRNLSISSLYDIDYFVLQLNETKQVFINTGKATGFIEDANGGIYGYLSEDGESVFDLRAGTYYIKVKNDILGKTKFLQNSLFNEYEYHVHVNINEITYYTDNQSSSMMLMRTSNSPKYLDATPGNGGNVNLVHTNKVNTDQLFIEIYTAQTLHKVYTATLPSQTKGSTVLVNWKGQVSYNRDIVANRYYSESNRTYHHWAKNGSYIVYVYPKGKTGQAVIYNIIVDNDALNEHNWLPVPPKTDYDGSKVTEKNKEKCGKCINYFHRYVLDVNSPAPLTAYVAWSREMYGLNGLEKFWQGADALIYNPNIPIIDNIHNTMDLIGLIPVLGSPADGINTVVYLIRGDEVNALISAAAMVPYVEVAANGKKIAGLKKYVETFAKSPCNCFAAGTLVLTDQGYTNIEDIQLGDLVLAKNELTGDIDYKPVEFLFEKEVEELYIITAGGIEIVTTENHPFWIEEKGWIVAAELEIGDRLERSDSSPISINNIEIRRETSTVYNMTVAEYHTYFVTELDLLTHNLVCYNYIIDNLPTTLVDKRYTQNSTILGDQLTKAGYAKPPIEGEITGWAAHHIVPATEKRFNSAKDAREILDNLDFNVNSAANGVWLPIKKGDKTIEFIDENTQVIWKAATHNGSHSKKYYDYVFDRIFPYENDIDGVVYQINEIRKQLLSGEITLGNF